MTARLIDAIVMLAGGCVIGWALAPGPAREPAPAEPEAAAAAVAAEPVPATGCPDPAPAPAPPPAPARDPRALPPGYEDLVTADGTGPVTLLQPPARAGPSSGRLACARQDFFFMRDAAFIDRYVDGLSAAGVPRAA